MTKEEKMRVIKVEFERLNDVTLERVYGKLGVYVLWSGNSQSRPAYIGEGSILKRFASHVDTLRWPISGVMALIGDDRPPQKTEAEIVEAILLEVADEIGRFPTQNKARGKYARVFDVFRKHGVLRLSVSGYDPLLHPKHPKMRSAKLATVRMDSSGEIDFTYKWNRRAV